MTMQSVRLTLLVRADESGLGYQTRAYYKHLKPHKTVIIDISNLNGNLQHYDWYENAHIIKGFPTLEQVKDILQDTDVLMTTETPYFMDLYKVARDMGVKTICVENPEFYDFIKYPQYELPDLIILPSVWKLDEIKQHAESKGTKVIQLHHPVDRDDFPFTLRKNGKPMHIAGKPATCDRNGTWDFMKSCPNGVVTTQNNDLAWRIRRSYRSCNVKTDITNPAQLYSLGDILVLPRKYGGNCLPLNEALSSGMPVIMPDISPNNHILPKEWLVPATIVDYFEPRTRVDIYQVDVDVLADTIQRVKDNIRIESQKANAIADTISWATLLPLWEQAIESVL